MYSKKTIQTRETTPEIHIIGTNGVNEQTAVKIVLLRFPKRQTVAGVILYYIMMMIIIIIIILIIIIIIIIIITLGVTKTS